MNTRKKLTLHDLINRWMKKREKANAKVRPAMLRVERAVSNMRRHMDEVQRYTRQLEQAKKDIDAGILFPTRRVRRPKYPRAIELV